MLKENIFFKANHLKKFSVCIINSGLNPLRVSGCSLWSLYVVPVSLYVFF